MNSRDKYEMDRDRFDKHQDSKPMSKMEVIDIINRLSLTCKDEFLFSDIERVKLWILTK